jgi:uncharacterized membrane protein
MWDRTNFFKVESFGNLVVVNLEHETEKEKECDRENVLHCTTIRIHTHVHPVSMIIILWHTTLPVLCNFSGSCLLVDFVVGRRVGSFRSWVTVIQGVVGSDGIVSVRCLCNGNQKSSNKRKQTHFVVASS